MPNLQTITLGYYTFEESKEIVIESMNISEQMIAIDLPKLERIELDFGALCGEYDDSCSLVMRSRIVF